MTGWPHSLSGTGAPSGRMLGVSSSEGFVMEFDPSRVMAAFLEAGERFASTAKPFLMFRGPRPRAAVDRPLLGPGRGQTHLPGRAVVGVVRRGTGRGLAGWLDRRSCAAP